MDYAEYKAMDERFGHRRRVNLPRMAVRITRDGGVPVLFLPDDPANPGMIQSYEIMGEHGEASYPFYYCCRLPKTEKEKANALHIVKFYEKMYGAHRLIKRINRRGAHQLTLIK